MNRKSFLIKTLMAPACAVLGIKYIPQMSLEEYSAKYIQPALSSGRALRASQTNFTIAPEIISAYARAALKQAEKCLIIKQSCPNLRHEFDTIPYLAGPP